MIAASRVTFAYARDGVFPGSKWWKIVNPYTKTPVNAVWFNVTIGIIMLLLIFGGAITIGALIAPAAHATIPGDDGAPSPGKPTVTRLPQTGTASCTTNTKPTRQTTLVIPSLSICAPYHASIETLRRNEHAIGVFEPPLLDAIDPDHERIALRGERIARGRRRTDEVADREAPGLCDAVAKPAHAPCLFDA